MTKKFSKSKHTGYGERERERERERKRERERERERFKERNRHFLQFEHIMIVLAKTSLTISMGVELA